METLLPITYLNDFVFCPYSIYLHQVFDNASIDVYSAEPQQKGLAVHKDVDAFVKSKENAVDIKGMYVVSTKLGLYGKIDTYYTQDFRLVEKKFQIKTIYKGYYYQLWAQYFAMLEMGYLINSLAFYNIKEQMTIEVNLPTKDNLLELQKHVRTIANYNFEQTFTVNIEKCKHCIYSSLCDKTTLEHVYA
jgi:CRISPR-associated exonuclease Cas4